MLRVLMVLEDYGELMFLQTVLKKIGFDVDAIQNPRAFGDSLLTMNPDVLVMTANGRRVKGHELSKTVKRVRGLPHIILLRGTGQPIPFDPDIGAWLETPVNALDLLNAMADFCGLNKDVLADKFTKLQMQDPEIEKVRVLKVNPEEEEDLEKSEDSTASFGTLSESTMSPEARRDRYKKFLKIPPPPSHGFSVKQVQDQVKALRKEEDPEKLDDLERERKAFVKHLFRKKD